jgi:hypothetical protein
MSWKNCEGPVFDGSLPYKIRRHCIRGRHISRSHLSCLNNTGLSTPSSFSNMQFSTTALAIISAFIASSTAADTLSFTISTCSACSTASGCLIERLENLPANRCIRIFDGNKSLVITAAANPSCKGRVQSCTSFYTGV